MFKEPINCPFCSGNLLQELEPTGLELEDTYWTIFHWQCLECSETFDKFVEEGYIDEFESDNGEASGSGAEH